MSKLILYILTNHTGKITQENDGLQSHKDQNQQT